MKRANIRSASWLTEDSVSPAPVLSSHHVAGDPDIALGWAVANWGQTHQCGPGQSLTQPRARTGAGRKGGKGWSWHLLPRPHLRDFLPSLALPVFLPGPWRPFPPRNQGRMLLSLSGAQSFLHSQTSRSGPLGPPRKQSAV